MTKHTDSANQDIIMNAVQGDAMEGNKIQVCTTPGGNCCKICNSSNREQQASQACSLVFLAQGGADS